MRFFYFFTGLNIGLYMDVADIRTQAANVAVYFIILGIGNLAGSFLQFWGVAQVGEHASCEMRGKPTCSHAVEGRYIIMVCFRVFI